MTRRSDHINTLREAAKKLGAAVAGLPKGDWRVVCTDTEQPDGIAICVEDHTDDACAADQAVYDCDLPLELQRSAIADYLVRFGPAFGAQLATLFEVTANALRDLRPESEVQVAHFADLMETVRLAWTVLGHRADGGGRDEPGLLTAEEIAAARDGDAEFDEPGTERQYAVLVVRHEHSPETGPVIRRNYGRNPVESMDRARDVLRWHLERGNEAYLITRQRVVSYTAWEDARAGDRRREEQHGLDPVQP